MSGFARRIVGIDLARGLAILGMVVLHAIPADAAGLPGNLLELFGSERTQVLFALLDGIALGILTDWGTRHTEARREERRRVAVRAVFLIALGLTLGNLGSGIIVILDYYGVYFLLVLPILYVRVRVLLPVAAALMITGPWVVAWASTTLLQPAPATVTWWPPLASEQLLSWALLGRYPAWIWVAFVLVGVAVWRLWRGRPMPVLALAAVTVVAVSSAVTETFVVGELRQLFVYLGATASMVGVIKVALWITCSTRFGRVVKAVVRPLSAAGEMPMTTYTVHVISFAIIATFVPLSSLQSIQVFLWSLLLFAAATVWSVLLGKGPTERAVHWLVNARSSDGLVALRPLGSPLVDDAEEDEREKESGHSHYESDSEGRKHGSRARVGPVLDLGPRSVLIGIASNEHSEGNAEREQERQHSRQDMGG